MRCLQFVVSVAGLLLASPAHAQEAAEEEPVSSNAGEEQVPEEAGEAPESAGEEAATEAAADLVAAQEAAAAAQASADDALARVAALEAAGGDEDEVGVGFKGGKGLKISSADGRYSLNTHMRGQFKAILEGDDGAGALGFQLRRARLTFSGKLGSEDVGYKVQLAFAPGDVGTKDGVVTTSPLLDWYVDFKQFDSANIRVGQYKVPYTREQLISSSALNLVDRSLTHSEFTLDRDIGITVHSKAPGGVDKVRYAAAIMSGEGRNKTDVVDLGLLYVARVDVMPLGSFKDMKMTDLARSETPKVAVGAAVAWLDEAKKDEGIKGNTPSDGGTTDTLNVTADWIFKLKGFSTHGAVHWRKGTRNPGTDLNDNGEYVVDDPRDGWGWFVQAGWLLPLEQNVDVVGRFAQVRGLGETSLSDANEVTLGLGWYINGAHTLKLQGDLAHTWGDEGVPDGETRLWAQLQVAY